MHCKSLLHSNAEAVLSGGGGGGAPEVAQPAAEVAAIRIEVVASRAPACATAPALEPLDEPIGKAERGRPFRSADAEIKTGGEGPRGDALVRELEEEEQEAPGDVARRPRGTDRLFPKGNTPSIPRPPLPLIGLKEEGAALAAVGALQTSLCKCHAAVWQVLEQYWTTRQRLQLKRVPTAVLHDAHRFIEPGAS
jgi:hypothetical protein